MHYAQLKFSTDVKLWCDRKLLVLISWGVVWVKSELESCLDIMAGTEITSPFKSFRSAA